MFVVGHSLYSNMFEQAENKQIKDTVYMYRWPRSSRKALQQTEKPFLKIQTTTSKKFTSVFVYFCPPISGARFTKHLKCIELKKTLDLRCVVKRPPGLALMFG